MHRSTLCVVVLLALLGWVLAGCGLAAASDGASGAPAEKNGAQPPASGDAAALPEADAAGRVHIRWFVGLGTGTSRAAQEVARAFVEQYNASQEEIELLLEVNSSGGVYGGAERLRPQVEAGRAPDVVGPTGVLGLSLFPGLWLDLDPLIEGAGDIAEDMRPEIADACRVGGRLVGLPAGINPSVLYYNRDLFDAAGLPYPPHAYGESYDGEAWTVDKMHEIALRLTLDTSGRNATAPDFDANRIAQYGYDWRWASGRGMAYLFGAGSPVDAEGNVVIPDHWRQAYRWYYAGMWSEHFIPDGPTYRGAFGYNPFVSGRIAMLQSHLWYLPRLVDVPFGWDIAALPSYDGRHSVRWDSDVVSIVKTTEHPREAFEVASALVNSPELLTVWGDLPADERLRAGYVQVLERRYPEVDWQAAVEGLAYLAVPPHGSLMPNHAAASARFDELRDAMEYSADLDLDAEIARLAADLQSLFAQARRPTPTPAPAPASGQGPPPP